MLHLDRWVTTVSRHELGEADASGTVGIDISAHPEAKSKVAKDMQARSKRSLSHTPHSTTLFHHTPPRPKVQGPQRPARLEYVQDGRGSLALEPAVGAIPDRRAA